MDRGFPPRNPKMFNGQYDYPSPLTYNDPVYYFNEPRVDIYDLYEYSFMRENLLEPNKSAMLSEVYGNLLSQTMDNTGFSQEQAEAFLNPYNMSYYERIAYYSKVPPTMMKVYFDKLAPLKQPHGMLHPHRSVFENHLMTDFATDITADEGTEVYNSRMGLMENS